MSLSSILLDLPNNTPSPCSGPLVEILRDVFDNIDEDASGKIKEDELTAFLLETGEVIVCH